MEYDDFDWMFHGFQRNDRVRFAEFYFDLERWAKLDNRAPRFIPLRSAEKAVRFLPYAFTHLDKYRRQPTGDDILTFRELAEFNRLYADRRPYNWTVRIPRNGYEKKGGR